MMASTANVISDQQPHRRNVFRTFQATGFNSSHFVWFLAPGIRFFESKHGWVFAYRIRLGVALVALEPLKPCSYSGESYSGPEWTEAWEEFVSHQGKRPILFVAIYSEFARFLRLSGFQTVRVGEEPWVDLNDCIPRGNTGKGVRSARNQAIRAGIQVEELPGYALSVPIQSWMSQLLEQWRNRNLLELSGFLNATDPFSHAELRRYFVAKDAKGQRQGFLVATPVPARNGYFLEDLVLQRDAHRGAGELLMLDAMVALKESGAREVSLGVVSAREVRFEKMNDRKLRLALVFFSASKFLARILNLNGVHIFRRRFKPHRWEQVHLALHPGTERGKSSVFIWLLALTALFLEFRPRLRFSLRWLYDQAIEPIARHPSATLVAALSAWLFFRFNHGGSLPAEIREHFSFTAQAPFSEWLGRSVISDFLYLNARQFWLWGTATVLVIGWAEYRTSRLTAALVVLGTSLFDDLVNYAIITHPLLYFRPQVFQKLIQIQDVGGSLILMTVLGFALRSLQKNRELFFVSILLLLVLSVGIRFEQLHLLILNLNHSLFLCIGFLLGQWRVQLIRARSRKVARLKPPEGRTVLSAQ